MSATPSSVCGGGFNPVVELPGLVWFLNVDFANIVAGEIDSIVDLKNGGLFAAPTAANRMPLNTLERPGHQVAQSSTSTRFLQCADNAIADSIAGNTDCTGFSFCRPTSFSSANNIIKHRDAADTRFIQFRSPSGATSGWSMNRRDAVSNLITSVAYTRTTVWQFVLWTYTASSRTLEVFQDNVSKGTAVFGSAVAPAAADISLIDWGGNLGFYSISGVTTNVMTAFYRTALYEWILANA